MKKNYLKTPSFLLCLIWLLTGCVSGEKTIDELSAHYKQYRDYESLVALMPHLNYTTTRADVEKLLGEPMCNYTCFYLTDQSFIVFCPDETNISRATCQSFPLVLTVNYDLLDNSMTSPQDRLANFSLVVMGE